MKPAVGPIVIYSEEDSSNIVKASKPPGCALVFLKPSAALPPSVSVAMVGFVGLNSCSHFQTSSCEPETVSTGGEGASKGAGAGAAAGCGGKRAGWFVLGNRLPVFSSFLSSPRND